MNFIIQTKSLKKESSKPGEPLSKAKQATRDVALLALRPGCNSCKYHNLALRQCLFNIFALLVVLFSSFCCLNLESFRVVVNDCI